MPEHADTLGKLLNNTQTNTDNTHQSTSSGNSPEIDYLKSIDKTLQELLDHADDFSQSSAKDKMPNKKDYFNKKKKSKSSKFGKKFGNDDGAVGQFVDGFERSLLEGFVGSDFKDSVRGAFDTLAKTVGVDLEDVPDALGKELGRQAMSAIKHTGLGSALADSVTKKKDKLVNDIKSGWQTGVGNYSAAHSSEPDTQSDKSKQSNQDVKDVVNSDKAKSDVRTPSGKSMSSELDDVKDAIRDEAVDKAKSVASSSKGSAADFSDDVLKQFADARNFTDTVKTVAAESQGAGKALAGIKGVAAKLTPYLAQAVPVVIAVGAALVALKVAAWALGPAIEGTKKLFEGMKKAGNRYNESRDRNLKLAQDRAIADLETVIKEPFNILKEAANNVYQAWDNNVRLINGTQGYTKADLQSLLGTYSQRLRSEGLSDVVSGVDVTESLAKVLSSGLSGRIAEEFAYNATVLNAAIPNQDFFGYADSYAAIVANAVKNGKSQAEAVALANNQLKLFASDVLYASRQLSGGFTTGLKDAQSLFDQAVQIAQASKFGNPSEIAGVLTAVAAVTGSIAPDLATSMTDAITKAATGGNSPEVVALRSLAGINASNTEFLRQVATNPQKVFTQLFKNLADLQNMSNDNYMEVAEGLSTVFGISMDAFARIDFNYLADAIANMKVNDASLAENMKLLASGETTTSKEQLRMQQINKYLIDEGLSYVMDNEVARQIQEHMWDEQMQRELMEATYAVELKGAALEFLEGIRRTVDNITAILNPAAWGNKLSNVVRTAAEAEFQEADVKQILELGKVGNGNLKSLIQLTTRNKDLHVAPDYISMLGGVSLYGIADQLGDIRQAIGHTGIAGLGTSSSDIAGAAYSTYKSTYQYILSSVAEGVKSVMSFGDHSKYGWGVVGKSASRAMSILPMNTASSRFDYVADNSYMSNAQAANDKVRSQIDKMLEDAYMRKFVAEGKSYEDWAKSAKNFGISDLSKALKDVGYSEEQVRARFQSAEVEKGIIEEKRVREKEEQYWDTMTQYTLDMVDLTKYANSMLDKIYANNEQYLREWTKYFIDHEVYNKAFTTRDQVKKVQAAEKAGTEDAIYALAEALSSNSIDLLKDPTLQTNALLSQILLVVNAIMQQNNKLASNNSSLPDTLSALAMGLVNKI